jgi:hypothetical protein
VPEELCRRFGHVLQQSQSRNLRRLDGKMNDPVQYLT